MTFREFLITELAAKPFAGFGSQSPRMKWYQEPEQRVRPVGGPRGTFGTPTEIDPKAAVAAQVAGRVGAGIRQGIFSQAPELRPRLGHAGGPTAPETQAGPDDAGGRVVGDSYEITGIYPLQLPQDYAGHLYVYKPHWKIETPELQMNRPPDPSSGPEVADAVRYVARFAKKAAVQTMFDRGDARRYDITRPRLFRNLIDDHTVRIRVVFPKIEAEDYSNA